MYVGTHDVHEHPYWRGVKTYLDFSSCCCFFFDPALAFGDFGFVGMLAALALPLLPPHPLLDAEVKDNCSSLPGVVEEEVGVGNADVNVTAETWPIIGDELSITGEFRFFWPLKFDFANIAFAL